MHVLVGTSGYSYKGWKGTFYPEDLPAGKMLAYYAEHFPAVEINNTFYRLPSKALLEGWARQVPDDFLFVLKASRRITHIKRLNDVGDAVSYLLENVSVLGDKLGPLFFQLPPYLKKNAARLRDLLDLLPAGLPVAFEFRDASWFVDETFEALRAHDAALCIADTDEPLDVPTVATASWGYLRLRRDRYAPDAFDQWARFIREQAWERAFVFFKHEDRGDATRLASRFMQNFP